MSEEQNIFNEQGAAAPQENQAEIQPSAEENPVPQQPAIPPELVDWVGPGKKYSSIDEVYKAFPNAQNHIQTQQQKIAELEAELNKRKSAEEVLNEIRSKETSQQKPTSQGVEVNEQILLEMVKKQFDIRSAQDNLKAFKEQFSAAYGDKASSMYANLSKETGLSFDELNVMASKSPQAVLKLAGISSQPKAKPMSSISGSVNTQAVSANAVPQDQVSAKVKPYANSKELAEGWRRAGEIVKKRLQG